MECVSDAEFLIKFSMKPPFNMDSDRLTFNLDIDGQPITESSFSKYKGPIYSFHMSTVCERVSPDGVVRRALKFASIRKGGNAKLSYTCSLVPMTVNVSISVNLHTYGGACISYTEKPSFVSLF